MPLHVGQYSFWRSQTAIRDNNGQLHIPAIFLKQTYVDAFSTQIEASSPLSSLVIPS